MDSRDWDLFVIDMPKINAFVLPTKEIFVYAGLIDLLEKEEPLIAAVMAHEISASPESMCVAEADHHPACSSCH